MFFGVAVALAFGQPVPATPEQEARIHSALTVAVDRMKSTSACDFPKPNETDLLAVVAAYEGRSVPTATVAGQDQDTSLADIVVGSGANPVYLVVTSYDPVIWRISGDVKRVREVIVFHQYGAGVMGIPASDVHFSKEDKCRLSYNLYDGRTVEHDVPVLAMFGRRANLIGGDYALYRATIEPGFLHIDRTIEHMVEDRIVSTNPGDPILPKRDLNGTTELERDFHEFMPAGVTEVDPRNVVASGTAERYEVLPKTAGAYQLEKSGALVAATASDIRRWKDRAVIGGHVRADRIDDLDFHSAYRITRPIRLPSGLCGAYSLTFITPSRDYVKGDPCHSNVYVQDGTVMYGVGAGGDPNSNF